MKRAVRASGTVKHGTAILNLLRKPEHVALLVQAAETDKPPVSAVAPLLMRTFPVADLKTVPVKTTIGLIVRALLAEHDYARAERGVRTNRDEDQLFTSGSVYEKVEVQAETPDDGSDDLINLIVATAQKMLTPSSRRTLVARLSA